MSPLSGDGDGDDDSGSRSADERRARLDELRRNCTRWVAGHGARTPAELLATIPAGVEPDRYGAGGVVAELEAEVAGLLGTEAALFVPSGTMAQQATLRVHAERRNRTTVVWHPACHLDWHEGRGHQRLHGLSGVPAGQMRRPLGPDDLAGIAEAPAALLLELPQRDLGGTLPTWDGLEAMVGWARQRGAAVHMDGARLWEAAPWFADAGHSLAEVVGLFDTTYVSFYKGLGALAGCCVAGPADVIAEVSEWRTRHGGRLFAMWPYAAAALSALRERRERMPAYRDHAVAIADALRDHDLVEVLPDPPQSPMLHLRLRVTPADLERRAVAIAEDERTWTFAEPFATDGPDLVRLELTVGDATMAIPADEVASLVGRLATGGSPAARTNQQGARTDR